MAKPPALKMRKCLSIGRFSRRNADYGQLPAMRSDAFSAIIRVAALVLADGIVGMDLDRIHDIEKVYSR